MRMGRKSLLQSRANRANPDLVGNAKSLPDRGIVRNPYNPYVRTSPHARARACGYSEVGVVGILGSGHGYPVKVQEKPCISTPIPSLSRSGLARFARDCGRDSLTISSCAGPRLTIQAPHPPAPLWSTMIVMDCGHSAPFRGRGANRFKAPRGGAGPSSWGGGAKGFFFATDFLVFGSAISLTWALAAGHRMQGRHG